MKKIVLLLLSVALIYRNASAEEYTPRNDEWGIPKEVRTEADLAKYERYRTGFSIATIGLLVGSIAANTYADRLHRRAHRIREYDASMVLQRPNGEGYYPLVQSNMDRKANLTAQSKAYKQGAIAGVLLSLICASITFSLRF
jgi:hypothetical protein